MSSTPSDPDDAHADLRRGANAVAGGILVSRILGLLREIVTARLLGVGVGVEAFKAALRVPNLLQNLLGEGVLSAAFVPVYSRMISQGRHDDARSLAGAVLGWLLVITVFVVIAVVVFARPITRVLVWGLVEGTQRFELTVQLVRIVTPGIGLLVVSAWCLGLLNAHRRFFLAYVAPAVWNLTIITAVVAAAIAHLTDTGLATAMAVGALVGSALQMAVQLPRVMRLTGGVRPSVARHPPDLTTVGRQFLRVVGGRGSVQLSGYVDLLAASLLAAGAIAAIGYAQVLYLLPIGLFGMSIAASELPALSTMDHGDRRAVVERLESGLGRVAFFIAPTTVVFVVLGDGVTATVFGGGRFGDAAALQIGIVLAAYALGLPAAAGSRLLQSALYGIGDASTPARSAATRVGVAAIVGVAAMLPLDAFTVMGATFGQVTAPSMQIAGLAERAASDSLLRLGAVGLALGASCGAWLELMLLRRAVGRSIGHVRILGAHGRAVLIATVVAVAAAIVARSLPALQTVSLRVQGIAGMLLVGALYLAACHALHVPEAHRLRSLWHTMFSRARRR